MRTRSDLPIHDAFIITSDSHKDARGHFQEWFWGDECEFKVIQGNVSTSNRNVVRGLHVSVAPAGQAKWVTCIAGAINDVLLDLRPSSPTYLNHYSLIATANSGISISIPSGVAHGFCSLEHGTVVAYLVSEKFDNENEVGIFPLDPDLGISWGTSDPILSEKDSQGLQLKEFLKRFEIEMGYNFGN